MRALFQAPLEAHANNIHCLALAVNQVFGALFSLSPQQDVEDRYCQIIFVRTTVDGHLFYLVLIILSFSKFLATFLGLATRELRQSIS